MIHSATVLSVPESFHASALDNTYALDTGEAGARRLDKQSDYIHKTSCDFLTKAGLKEGQIVCDIACGTGFMTLHMASMVGPQGHVYALDYSAAQLELAQKRLQESGFTNVTFVQGDILSDICLTQKADLVYSRFLLMHLKDPRAAIQHMLGFLKSKGTLVLEEPVTSTCYVADDNNQLSGFIKSILALGNHLELDYDIGIRLKALTKEQGLIEIQQEEHQKELDPVFARDLLLMTHKEWSGRSLKEGVISEYEYAIFEKEIRELNKPFWISKQVYITGQKK